MILNDDEIAERIESPLNLLNRLKKINGSSSAVKKSIDSPSLPSIRSPFIPPSSSDLIEDLDDKIAEAASRKKATAIMNKAMNELDIRIPEVQKPETLAKIASDMSKIVSNQAAASSASRGATSQIIVYAPQIQAIDNFEVIDVKEQ